MIPGETFVPYQRFREVIVVPDAIAKCPDLSAGAKLTWARLARYAGQDGRCYPSLAALGLELGMSKKCARRFVHELMAAGLIQSKRRTSEHGAPDSSEYEFLWHLLFEAEGVVPKREVPTPETGSTVVPKREVGVLPKWEPKENQLKRVTEERKQSAPKTGAGSLCDSRFDQLWEQWPRKKSKKAARRAFDKAVKAGNWEKMWAGAQAQLPGMLQMEPKFRKHLATWINGECWNDEPDPTASEQDGADLAAQWGWTQ